VRNQFGEKEHAEAFKLELLTASTPLEGFSCLIKEYNDYIYSDALRSQNDHIALTWLLREQATGATVAYLSLIADTVKLSASEKEIHKLNYLFKTIPAMKIAKIAVSKVFSEKYRGIGSFMINVAASKALGCNNDYCAARFLTVDADIEHDKGVLAFYEKNGFAPNAELFNKNRKTISMRKDLYA
jgi:GNAT superfamily N-acetyltransferase